MQPPAPSCPLTRFLLCSAGKCAANFRTDELDLNTPKELLGLDTMHKCSTQRNVEKMTYGRFGTGEREFFGQKAVERSNYSVPSRLFLDPYHVSDGNLWAENFMMGRFQRGGQTAIVGRNSILKFEKERFGKEDMQSRARSKYVEPEGGRFVPALKPGSLARQGPRSVRHVQARQLDHPRPGDERRARQQGEDGAQLDHVRALAQGVLVEAVLRASCFATITPPLACLMCLVVPWSLCPHATLW